MADVIEKASGTSFLDFVFELHGFRSRCTGMTPNQLPWDTAFQRRCFPAVVFIEPVFKILCLSGIVPLGFFAEQDVNDKSHEGQQNLRIVNK